MTSAGGCSQVRFGTVTPPPRTRSLVLSAASADHPRHTRWHPARAQCGPGVSAHSRAGGERGKGLVRTGGGPETKARKPSAAKQSSGPQAERTEHREAQWGRGKRTLRPRGAPRERQAPRKQHGGGGGLRVSQPCCSRLPSRRTRRSLTPRQTEHAGLGFSGSEHQSLKGWVTGLALEEKNQFKDFYS